LTSVERSFAFEAARRPVDCDRLFEIAVSLPRERRRSFITRDSGRIR
jgi:hypothetical protein